jgi:hypothetical protein
LFLARRAATLGEFVIAAAAPAPVAVRIKPATTARVPSVNRKTIGVAFFLAAPAQDK